MPIQWRGLAPDKERGWVFNIQRENKLRLEWFRKNEQRLNEIAYEELKKAVPQEVKDSFEQEMLESFEHHTHIPRRKTGEPDPIDLKAEKEIMRSIDPTVSEHIYRKEVGGRRAYFKLRNAKLPDKRYYLPETSNMLYGWKMYNHQATKYGFGRKFIVEHTFYRRQGVQKDPDWYREPTITGSTSCAN